MKIQELIEKLQKVQEELGNVEVYAVDNSDTRFVINSYPIISVGCDYFQGIFDKKRAYISYYNKEWAD